MSALSDVVQQHLPRLQAVSEERAAHKPAPEVWSAKQVLGHLIDSGVNNYACFMHASLKSHVELPDYAQDDWVRLGGYQERPWAEVLALWEAVQLQVARVIANVPPESLGHTVSIGGDEPISLDALTTGYVRHQLHHLAQVWERAEG
ncbi:DinB family protein [Deinococcus altitudinis]|uniref:DinB family protein n=1 Tax=Deinococcus altitudinis TaxID=468914 RepID=UPI0038914BD1